MKDATPENAFLAYIESLREGANVKRTASHLWRQFVTQARSGAVPAYRAGSTGEITLLELEFEGRELLIDIDSSSGSLIDCLLVEGDTEHEGPIAATSIPELARWLAQGAPLPSLEPKSQTG